MFWILILASICLQSEYEDLDVAQMRKVSLLIEKVSIYKFVEKYQWKMLYSFFTFNYCRQELIRGLMFLRLDVGGEP